MSALNEMKIAITGAGLVGSLMATMLARRGYSVHVFERRPDMRKKLLDGGRSINLALSNRGIRALESIGLADELKRIAIPMHGRMMHDIKGNLTPQAYGKEGEYINSISRSALNMSLMDAAEAAGVKFYFEHRCVHADLQKTVLTFDVAGSPVVHGYDLIIGADGAFSAIRSAMQVSDRFDYSQYYIEHGYKELTIPPDDAGNHRMERHALHIWPRASFMLIALPNPDGSFTCTLFFPFEGSPSFQELNDAAAVKSFFEKFFPDAAQMMPTLVDDFFRNPPSSLVTVKCFPWVKKHTLLIGDAAHAIVPFYGQGMNAGFEDCSILNGMLDRYNDDWNLVLEQFPVQRKPDADAIAQLALDNFVEMRDLVGDADFLLRKKIEARLHALYPEKWIPLYTMVTFREDIRYSTAMATGSKQRAIMDEVMQTPDIATRWETLNFQSIVDKLNNA